MKKLIVLSCLFVSFFAAAQEDCLGVGASLDVYAFQFDELNQLVSSINNYYEGNGLETSMEAFEYAPGGSFLLGGNMGGVGLTLGYWLGRSMQSASGTASFENGRGIEIKARHLRTVFMFDLGGTITDHIVLSGTLSASLWRNDVHYYNTYPYDIKSVATNDPLPGLYSSVKASFGLGMDLSGYIGPIRIGLRAIKDFGVGASDLGDFSPAKLNVGNYLPKDITQPTSQPDNRITSQFPGVLFSLSIAYCYEL